MDDKYNNDRKSRFKRPLLEREKGERYLTNNPGATWYGTVHDYAYATCAPVYTGGFIKPMRIENLSELDK